MVGNFKIPVCRPSISSLEKTMVNLAIDRNAISSIGGFVEEFEELFAKKIGTKYCIAVNSGGSALFLALWVLGIKKGDEVIVPDFTMIATANAVIQCGARPVFVDAKYDTGNIDPYLIEEKITKRTKAIIPVHIYGHPCPMREIMEIADRYGLYVIEDAAEAHGAEYNGGKVGSIGDLGCFSFYANKIITTGEGGAITTNNKRWADELRKLRAYYFSEQEHFKHDKLGYNFRMSSLEAALGIGQLQRWDELIGKHIAHARFYTKYLKGIVKTPIQKEGCKNVYWMYFIKTLYRDKLMKYLANKGIETRTAFIPMHQQKFLKNKGLYPIADKLSKNGLYLPSASDLTQEEQIEVIEAIKESNNQ